MRKNLLSALLLLCIFMLALTPLMAAADALPSGDIYDSNEGNDVDDEGWSYDPKTNTLTITKDFDDETGPWYEWNNFSNFCETIIIKEGVTVIGNMAFRFFRNLRKIEISDSVKSIGKSAFQSCWNLNEITIPDSVTLIDDGAFSNCGSLTGIELPDNIYSIKADTFAGCGNLSTIEIPSGVKEISGSAFSGCNSLIGISVADDNETYSEKDGVLYNKNQNELLRWPGGNTSVQIPDSVEIIGEGAFSGCQFEMIEIPETVAEIKQGAFSDCSNLTNITIPENVTSIEQGVFSNCSSLTSIIIPKNVTSIGENAFSYCSELTNITIPEKVTSIGEGAFSNCNKLTSIIIPNDVTIIQPCVFEGCDSLRTVYLPAGLREIGSNNFSPSFKPKTFHFAGTEEEWAVIEIAENNDALNDAFDNGRIKYNSTYDPDNPAGPDSIDIDPKDGGLGKELTILAESGNWLTIQTSRDSAISIASFQVPDSYDMYVPMTFSAPEGSEIQIWETEDKIQFDEDGVPLNTILRTTKTNLTEQ